MNTVTVATQIIGYSVDKIGEAIRSVGGSSAAAWAIAARETFAEGLAYVLLGLLVLSVAQWVFRVGMRKFMDADVDEPGPSIAMMVLSAIFGLVGFIIACAYLSNLVAPNKELATQVISAMKYMR